MSNLKGFNELAKKMRNIEGKLANRVVRKGVSKMAQVVRKEMRSNAKTSTGKLKKGLRYKVSRLRNGGYQASVGAYGDAFYAKFLNDGAKAHRIPKKKGKKVVLNGKVVQNIQHPGVKGNKFLTRAYESSRDRAIKEAGVVMMKELLKL